MYQVCFQDVLRKLQECFRVLLVMNQYALPIPCIPEDVDNTDTDTDIWLKVLTNPHTTTDTNEGLNIEYSY